MKQECMTDPEFREFEANVANVQAAVFRTVKNLDVGTAERVIGILEAVCMFAQTQADRDLIYGSLQEIMRANAKYEVRRSQ